MSNKDSVTTVRAVVQGGKFCSCGGLYETDKTRGLLMSDPPQTQLKCPFCGSTDTVVSPYDARISFTSNY